MCYRIFELTAHKFCSHIVYVIFLFLWVICKPGNICNLKASRKQCVKEFMCRELINSVTHCLRAFLFSWVICKPGNIGNLKACVTYDGFSKPWVWVFKGGIKSTWWNFGQKSLYSKKIIVNSQNLTFKVKNHLNLFEDLGKKMGCFFRNDLQS